MDTLFKLVAVTAKLIAFHPRRMATTWRCYRAVTKFNETHKRQPTRREAGYLTAPHMVALTGHEAFIDVLARRYVKGQMGEMDLGALEWLRDNSKVTA